MIISSDLRAKVFKGMVVTDHDSYGGYDAYLSYVRNMMISWY